MLRRYAYRILGPVLAILLLAGCAGGIAPAPTPTPEPTPTPAPTPVPVLEITVAAGEVFPEDFVSYLEDTRGIRLAHADLDEANWQGDLPEADLYILDSNYDLPALEAAVAQGIFRGLPHSAYAGTEGLAETLDRYYPFWNDGAGNLTAIPAEVFSDEGVEYGAYTLYFRRDWSKRLGFSEAPEDGEWADMIARATAFAHMDPDRDGISQTYGITAGGWDALTGLFLEDMGVRDWVLEDGKWVPGLMSVRAREGLAWLRQLYRDGVLDPASLTQTREEAMKLFGMGRVGMLITDSAEGFLDAWLEGHESDTEEDCLERTGVYPLPVNPYGTRYIGARMSPRVAMLDAAVPDAKIPVILEALTAWKAYQGGEPEYEDAAVMQHAASRQADYLPKAWTGPLFTDWLGDADVASFDVGIRDAAVNSFLEAALVGEDFDRAWTEWMAFCQSDLGADRIIARVNEAAAARGIVTEE